MIKVSASKAAESLRQAQIDIKRKLEGMVAGFGAELTRQASMSTPVGDADRIEQGESGTPNVYHNYYVQRQKEYGIEIAPGFHSGAWTFGTDSSFEFDDQIYETEQAESHVKSQIQSYYNLGETFYIGASGPGYSALENGYSNQAPNGIIKPTLEAIELLYQMEMKQVYERS